MIAPVALVLASAVLHAAWNAIVKRERDPHLAVIPVSAIGALVGATVAVGASRYAFPSRKALVFAVLAGVFEGAYFLALGRALARAPLSVVYTASRGGALVLVWPLSIALFAEPLAARSVAGAALVALGLAATSIGERRPGTVTAGGVGWAFATAAAIAGYHVSYKIALAAGAPPAATLALSMALGVALNLAHLDPEGRRGVGALVRTRPLPIVVAGLLTGGSFLLFLIALSGGGAGAMLTLRNTSVVFATAFALLIGERPSRAHWIGALLVAAGAALIAPA
ncbi:MAG: EamA family transporter [Deltaproteobacteria bacterium]|nr:EamA family transporter [Deltaproteobacteria bacterium]